MKILGVVPFGVHSFEVQAENARGEARALAIVHQVEGRHALDDARRMAIALGYELTDADLRDPTWRRIELPVAFRSGEDGWIVVECPAIRGCVSQGRTVEEARANIRDAIEIFVDERTVPPLPVDQRCEDGEA